MAISAIDFFFLDRLPLSELRDGCALVEAVLFAPDEGDVMDDEAFFAPFVDDADDGSPFPTTESM
jgi:hypothetical protein